MKKLFYLFVLTFSISLSVNSQITLEKKLFNSNMNKVTFTNYGDKYSTHKVSNSTQDTITIYNTDWTIFKTIYVPSSYGIPLYDGINPYFIGASLSDNLFNNDGLIEYIGCQPTHAGSEYYNFKVFDENGNTVYTFTDTAYRSVRVLKMGNNFKIQVGFDAIYSVPGSLPCDPCGALSGLQDPQNGGGISELRVNPNPFNNSLEINYEFLTRQDNPRLILTDILGRELKSIPLSNQSDRITLNTSDLPKGTIVVSLFGGQNMISKKVIKID